MFTKIHRDEKLDYLPNLEKYLKSPDISNTDKEIIEKLKEFSTEDNYRTYLSAFDNSCFNGNVISEDGSIITNDYVSSFWSKHREVVRHLIVPTEFCPACDISFNQEFKYVKTIEHVLPKSIYQQYILFPINLVYFCGDCNSKRGNEVCDIIFHPHLSDISCSCVLYVEIFRREDGKNGLKVKIEGADEIYSSLIKKTFKLHLKYKSFIENVINKEISSIEQVAQQLLSGIQRSERREKLSKIIVKAGSSLCDTYPSQTDIEKILLEKLRDVIQQHKEMFINYVIEKSSCLKHEDD